MDFNRFTEKLQEGRDPLNPWRAAMASNNWRSSICCSLLLEQEGGLAQSILVKSG